MSDGDGTGLGTVEVGERGIRLGQLLKLAGLVDTGGEAKLAVEQGRVRVNGAVETRRGAQLAAGDTVECDGRSVRLA
ncbi:ribosome-associated protein [Motilibacter peucedani]|uniref:Ribosome-associated protein n=1 Tax=Motilibacter peucedani TaxID=598650 RepID=A0A420XMU8_9ACTN|nr:RNA-binding S4 domain-containing protein [Motilibacter peucedani]RKS72599.1 ribosome-associated protein [Motilibacter peucedani]